MRGGPRVDKCIALWEIEQIKKLKARYFRLMDTKQWERYRALFTDDLCVFIEDAIEPDPNAEPFKRSADEFVRYVSQSALPSAVSAHHGHMPEIELTSATTAFGVWAMFDWVDDAHNGRA